MHNNHIHSDSKKRRGFRYATATPLSTAGDVKRYASGDIMPKFAILVSCILISIAAGCAERNIVKYSQVDLSNKTMLVHPGNSSLMGGLKHALIENGWQLRVYKGPSVSTGTIGENTYIETHDTFKAKYRLLVRYDRYTGAACKSDLGSWTGYEIVIIDNEAGTETFSISGRNNCGTIVDEFMKALNSR